MVETLIANNGVLFSLSSTSLLLNLKDQPYVTTMGESTEDDMASVQDVEKGAIPESVTDEGSEPYNQESNINPGGGNDCAREGDESKSPTNLECIASIGHSLHPVETEYGKRPSCFSTTLQEILFVLTTTFAVGQSSILIGLTSVITSHIGRSLNMTQAEITWINASSSLGAYAILCLIAGFATNAYYMDILTGLLGVASSGSVPPAMGLLGSIYKKPSARKNKAFACFSAGNPLGFVVGMLISGVSTSVANWRTSFWVTCVIYVFFTAVAFWTVPPDEQQAAPFNRTTLKTFDFLGALLSLAGIGLLTSGLSIAGDAPEGWKTPYVIVFLILGVFLIVGFVAWQGFFKHPLMPLYIWKDRNFSLLVLILSLGFMGFSGNSFWLCLFFQEIKRFEPIAIAARMLPMAIAGIIVNVIAGLVMHKISNKILMTIGSLGFCGCFALLSAMPADNNYWPFIFPALCLSVVGADFVFMVVNMYVMSSLPPSHQSIAGAILQTATRIVTAIGLGIQTAAFTSLSPSGSSTSTDFKPYRAAWWVAMGAAGFSLVFVPFITVRRQGDKKEIR
ncbi:putative aminotriazole resistance [Phaeomoniella chlamydospora]|uniref:Putative aminotriazole resistance n=1 Tax=Phaeomoniella chlamydospora TaxID=158046 RepID=A0A0G2DZH0_PHACM|nr:putative aminotriazole resistance [Phaeomoniella chlamydospora]